MRILEPFENHFWEFYNAQTSRVQEKIDFVLEIIISVEHVPRQFFKHLEDGIYEIRIKVGSDIYRIFCFFDKGRLVILLHAFQKKSRKTPRKEITRAKRLRKNFMKVKTINEHLDGKYGEKGTETRDGFSERAQAYMIAEMLKSARKEAHLTQQELADKLNVNRAYISKIERAISDIQLSTLKKVVEEGLGGKLHIYIEL